MTTEEVSEVKGDPISSRTSRFQRGRTITSWIAISTLIGFALLLMGGSLAHLWSIDTILSGSMEPQINPGDVIVATPENATDLRVGQILVLRPPGETVVVSHRIISIQNIVGGGVAVKTKGDANNVADPWRAQIKGGTAWTVKYVLPKIGYILIWTKVAWVKAVALVVVVLVLLWTGLEKIWKKSKEDSPTEAQPQSTLPDNSPKDEPLV